LYSTGLIAIQALTGLHPSQLQDEEETGEKSWRHQVEVSDRLAFFLDKMVRYHHKDRYVSAEEALGDLQKVVDGSLKLPEVSVAQVEVAPVAVVKMAEDGGSCDRKSVWMQRLKTAGLFAGGICVAVGIAAAVAPLLKSQQENQNAQQAAAKKDQAPATPTVAVNPKNNSTRPSASPTVVPHRPNPEKPTPPIQPSQPPIKSSQPPTPPPVVPTPSPQVASQPEPSPSPNPSPEPRIIVDPWPLFSQETSTSKVNPTPPKQAEQTLVTTTKPPVAPPKALSDPNCVPSLTPDNFAFHCARSGALKEYGIYGWNILDQDLRFGTVTPKSIVAAGIQAGLLPPETINDQSYINAVELHLSH
jgi:hypothetical protein